MLKFNDFSDVTLAPEDHETNCTNYEDIKYNDFTIQDPISYKSSQDDRNLSVYSLDEFLNLHSSNLSLPALVNDFEILSINTSAFQDELRHLSDSRRLTLDRSFFLMKSQENLNSNQLKKVLCLGDLLIKRMLSLENNLDSGFLEKKKTTDIVQTRQSPLLRSRRMRKSIRKTSRKTVKTMGRVRKVSNIVRRIKKTSKKTIRKTIQQVVGGFCKLLCKMF